MTTWWTLQLLDRSPTWNAWLQPLVVATGVIGTIGVLAAPYVGRGVRTAVLATAVIGGLAAPTGASIASAATANDGALPSASPVVAGGFGGARRPGRARRTDRPDRPPHQRRRRRGHPAVQRGEHRAHRRPLPAVRRQRRDPRLHRRRPARWPGRRRDGTANEITAWVEGTFAATTIGGTTVYDLTT